MSECLISAIVTDILLSWLLGLFSLRRRGRI
nr:MAG TPA: hypothetical protein [Caudoviricetes sp.]